MRTDRLTALFEAHSAFVARSLRRLGVPLGEVEDALQEVFLVAQSKIEFIESGKEKSFLFGIARRRASTLRRSHRRALKREEGHDEAPTSCDAPYAGEQAEQRYARALLDEVLDALPVELRTVLVLHELEEIEMAEIATLLEVPMGTVASRLRRARAKFEFEAERVRTRVVNEGSP